MIKLALSKGLTDKQKSLMDIILKGEDDRFNKVQDILKDSAKEFGRGEVSIKLYPYQVIPVLMMQVSKRVLNGFSPGIGKTYSACGSYAMYRLKAKKEGRPIGKVLCVTEGIHIHGFANDWKSGGVNLMKLSDGNQKITRALKKYEKSDEEFDGIITTWDSLKTNAFLMYYLEHSEEYNFAVFDETLALMNKGTNMFYPIVDNIINKYKGGIEYVMFLNGTNFNKNIYDIYNQMNLLVPKLIPSKSWIDSRYVIKEDKEIWRKSGGSSVLNKYQDIVDYKNQKDFFEQLKYYYIVKNKSDVSGSIPQHVYKFHGIEQNATIKGIISNGGSSRDINSPNTTLNIPLVKNKFPKLDYLIKRFEDTKEDRPIIYVYHRDAQRVIKKELESLGYKVGLLSGEIDDNEEKEKIRLAFNNGELDTLIFNIEKAINIPTSDRIIFYEIPVSPTSTNQIKARIDRNNYKDVKFYDFLCYLDSKEMENIVKLSYFREKHGKLLSGQGDDMVYGQLISQLEQVYTKERMDKIKGLVDEMYDNNKDWEDIDSDIDSLLNL